MGTGRSANFEERIDRWYTFPTSNPHAEWPRHQAGHS
jgi:hypothetical protein